VKFIVRLVALTAELLEMLRVLAHAITDSGYAFVNRLEKNTRTGRGVFRDVLANGHREPDSLDRAVNASPKCIITRNIYRK